MSFKPTITPETKFELATNNNRVAAILIDYFLVSLFVIPVYFINHSPINFYLLGMSVNTMLLLVYKIIFESLTGTTIGKKIMKIFVINNEHRLPSFYEVFLRHSFYVYIILIGIGYYATSYIPSIREMMLDKFSPGELTITGIILTKYLLRIVALVDLISINYDPEKQNRTLHDRLAKTLVVRIKSEDKKD